jgi:MoaA/NifB/PqqE/SkfB family radical SAM enzyme
MWGDAHCWGETPFLSIEITKECLLRCPGCYAYSPDHFGPLIMLRQLSDSADTTW